MICECVRHWCLASVMNLCNLITYAMVSYCFFLLTDACSFFFLHMADPVMIHAISMLFHYQHPG